MTIGTVRGRCVLLEFTDLVNAVAGTINIVVLVGSFRMHTPGYPLGIPKEDILERKFRSGLMQLQEK